MSRTQQPETGRQPAERPNGRDLFREGACQVHASHEKFVSDIGGSFRTDMLGLGMLIAGKLDAGKPEGLSFGLLSGSQLPSREAHIP
ncbi:MAG: hypothetical protein RLO52_01930 [Sandaracinaceae bacterium]